MAALGTQIHEVDRAQVVAASLLVAGALLPLFRVEAPQVIALLIFLFLLRFLSLLLQGSPAPPRWALMLLTIAGGLIVFDAHRSFSGQEGGVALLAVMAALKVLEIRDRRDIRVITVMFTCLLVVQFLLSDSALLAGYLLVLLIGNFALMADISFHADRQRLRTSIRVAAMAMLYAAPVAILLFTLFPRLESPLWDLGMEDQRDRSGIKGWMEPGSVTELVVSGEEAFRVRFEGPKVPTEPLYWRGPVLWHTDGRRWLPSARGDFPEASINEPMHADEIVRYHVVMEPSGQNWLFMLDLPLGAPPRARLTHDFQSISDHAIKSVRVFQGRSALRYKTPYPSLDEEVAALALPDNITRRERELVASWKMDSDRPEDLIQSGLSYFRQQPFYYTLIPPELGENTHDSFLFETRRGYCEHYAGSFALLMRIAGVPARIVLGYYGGEYNPISGRLLVRQSDAHAWVEVLLEKRGWVRVDPTNAVAADRIDYDSMSRGLGTQAPARFRLPNESGLRELVRAAGQLSDAIEAAWTSWVLNFSRDEQMRVLRHLGIGFLEDYGLVLSLIFSMAGVILTLALWTSRSRIHKPRIVRTWHRLTRKLGKAGLPVRRGEGPRDYLSRVAAERPELSSDLEVISRLYLAVRYGGIGSAQAQSQLDSRVNGLKTDR